MILDQVAKRGITQFVTETDIANSRIRVPKTGPTKALLPGEPGEIDVVLKGKHLGAVWYNPRFGPDRERSGVVSVPSATLRETVVVGERLPVIAGRDVVYIGDRGSKLRIAQWVNDN